jgi:hypothetical protein
MSQESPEQQMPLALSPTALAQRDANTMPTEYPKSIGKKTLDARYARDARRLPETTHWISARDDEGLSRLSLDADAAAQTHLSPTRTPPRTAQVPEPDGFEHVPRVEVREREEGREKIQPRVRPRASEPSASVRRPSSPRVSRRTETKN